MFGQVLRPERSGFVRELTGVAPDDKREGLAIQVRDHNVFITRLAAAMV